MQTMKKDYYYNKQTPHNLSKHKVTATIILQIAPMVAVGRSSLLGSNWLSAIFYPASNYLSAIVIKLEDATVTNGTVSARRYYTYITNKHVTF